MVNNPYEILGVSPNASNDEIKRVESITRILM